MNDIKLSINNVNAWYKYNHALKDVSIKIPANDIYAFIGPSGCGKTTLLRSINRLNDLIDGFKLNGEIAIDGDNVYGNDGEKRGSRYVQELRASIGMVFQQPNPLPTTVMKNMLLPIKERYKIKKHEMIEKSIENLKAASLFEEVKDRLHKSAMSLSGGQQQRLCIARALMLDPKIILLDEPCSALDPISTMKIEDLLMELKKKYTIIIVTHNMEQARRIASNVSFFFEGEIVESGSTEDLFLKPKTERLHKYIKGKAM